VISPTKSPGCSATSSTVKLAAMPGGRGAGLWSTLHHEHKDGHTSANAKVGVLAALPTRQGMWGC
jgi:2-methylcitrate dehydratase PrpD